MTLRVVYYVSVISTNNTSINYELITKINDDDIIVSRYIPLLNRFARDLLV